MPADGSFHDSDRRVRKEIYERGTFGGVDFMQIKRITALLLTAIPNIVPVQFTDGAYYNFPACQKIRDGIYLIRAKGHTNGNSIVIIEDDGLFYMIHGDVTYVDEALYENKLSTVFGDLPAARETQDRVREFVRNLPTVYCGTHTPQGYENLEAKRVMDLDNPVPTVLAEVDFSKSEGTGKYVCSICGYVYNPAEHNTHRLAQTNFQFIKDISGLPHCHQWRREPFMKKRRNYRKRNPPCRRAEGILYLGVITMFDPEGFIPGSGT